MDSLTETGLRTFYKTVCRAQKVRKEGLNELSDLFGENPRLIISPNNRCTCSCLHCVADSTPKGITIAYDDFAGIDPDFFKVFSAVDFGRKGNPLFYHSGGNDIVDLMQVLVDNGVNEFTLALALQNHPVPVLEKLEQFAQNRDVSIETMVTYHHYYEDLNILQLAKDFNATLKNYIGFSRKIIISLLGDRYSQNSPTKAEEVEGSFHDSWDTIFSDINLNSVNGGKGYHGQFKSNETQIKIPPIDHRVYPLGRFRQYLSDKGILEQYETQFEQSMSDYVCPDLIKWPGIIIEPDGSLNLCASFEAVTSNGAIVGNIFSKSYEEVKHELIQFHRKEMGWFTKNISGIMAGNVSTCKLKNCCYKCNRP